MIDPTRSVRIFARFIFPVIGPPIHEGVVTISGGKIVEVEPYRAEDVTPSRDFIDLGDSVLLPGLVNAHTHLELSCTDRPLGKPDMSLAEWITMVIAHRIATDIPIHQRVARGLAESRDFGTVLIGDIAQIDDSTDEAAVAAVKDASMPETVEFLELIAPTAELVDGVWQRVDPFLAAGNPKLRGLSPHAPYSTCSSLLRRAIDLSRKRRIPLAMHLAESAEELRLFDLGDGPLRDLVDRFGPWSPSNMAANSLLDFLWLLEEAHRALIIHGNYLDDASIAFLGKRRARMSVVFCPRCHARFGHRHYPLETMLREGVRVALGTDGRVSTPNLSLWAEMQRVAVDFPAVSGETIFRMGTHDGAAALGLADRFGAIVPGADAALVAAKIPGPHSTVFDSADPERYLLEAVQKVEPVVL